MYLIEAGGKNLLIEYRYAENKLNRLPDLAAELVRLKVDALVISPSPNDQSLYRVQ